MLQNIAATYETADLNASRADMELDLRSMPTIEDEQYDLVYASHVLEHIDDDMAALSEIFRILAPGGIAVLPVPIVADHTVEYSTPCPAEAFHVRAPGVDYFDRMRTVFGRVDVFSSDDFADATHTYVDEDRSVFPTPDFPERPGQIGRHHLDFVPVCIKVTGSPVDGPVS